MDIVDKIDKITHTYDIIHRGNDEIEKETNVHYLTQYAMLNAHALPTSESFLYMYNCTWI